jgi:hypothetical protein
MQSSADLSSTKENVEWIIDKVPIVRHELFYGCCPEPYPDVTFYIHLTTFSPESTGSKNPKDATRVTNIDGIIIFVT